MAINDAINSTKADYNEYDDSISDKSEDYNPVGPIFSKLHMLSLHSSFHFDSPTAALETFQFFACKGLFYFVTDENTISGTSYRWIGH